MKLWLAIFLFLTTPKISGAQPVYVSDQVVFSFFSKAPLEDISAKSSRGMSAIDISSKSIYFKVSIRTFEFRKRLMQQHFNEEYLESSKYPYAEFKGKYLEDIDLAKDGIYQVTVQGNLNIHNVTKNYTVKGQIQVDKGKIAANSKFRVRVADHRIKIPRLVIKNIAEVVEVQVSARYEPSPNKS